MPRRPNTKPTHIYWLVDIRPEILAAGWSNGQPFYCGKTIRKPEKRLAQHRRESKKTRLRPVLQRILECGDFIKIAVMETVPFDGDWVAREQKWILLLRHLNPECTNISDGGSGNPGWVQSPETIARRSAALKGRPLSLEHRAKLAAAKIGKKHSPEARARMQAVNAARYNDPAYRAKLSAASKRMWESPEFRKRYSEQRTGVKRPPGFGAKVSASKKGKPGKIPSQETRAKMSAAQQLRWEKRKAEKDAA